MSTSGLAQARARSRADCHHGSLSTYCALLLVCSVGCAPAPRPVTAPSVVPLTRRVADVLAHRHISPPTTAELSARLFAELRGALGCKGEASQALCKEPASLLDRVLLGDLSFLAGAFAGCEREPPPPERQPEFVSDALARAYDPHSRYLPPARFERFRTRVRANSDAAPRLSVELVEQGGHRIALLSLPEIYLHTARSASADLRRELSRVQARGAEVVVLDLRGNGGGVLRESARVFGVFVGPGMVAQMRRRDRAPEALTAPRDAPAWSGPLLVHVDAGTASVAEVLAAALQDSGRALLLGQRTYGKGTGQTLVPMGSPADPGEGAVDVTDRRLYRRDARPLQCAGVTPDIALPGPARPRECDHEHALAPDRLATPLAPDAPRVFATRADAKSVRAAIAYLRKSSLAPLR